MATERALPPSDITPHDFFVHWIGDAVANDATRREKLGETRAAIVFRLSDSGPEDPGGDFTVRIEDGRVWGTPGDVEDPQLQVQLEVATWRRLNSGDLSAPEALLRRKLKVQGDMLLGLKLHVILG